MLRERDEMMQRKLIFQAQAQHAQMHQQQQHMLPPPPIPMQMGPRPQMVKQKPQVIEVVQKGKKGGVKVYHHGGGSPRSSRSSIYSEDSYSNDGSDYTPNSSIDSSDSPSSRHHRRRSHSRHRRHDRPEQFGIEAPRHHSKHDQHFIMDSVPYRVPAAPLPPSPIASIDLDALQDEAYLQGRAFEKARALEEAAYRPRTALPPRIIQRRPSVRLVDPREVARERHEDAIDQLDRLRLDEEFRYDDEIRYDETLDAELRDQEFHRREALANRMRRDRLEHEALALEEEQIWEERRARDYMRRRDSEREPRVQFANPFAPVGGRARRHSTYYM
jgi:hypothetical protein